MPNCLGIHKLVNYFTLEPAKYDAIETRVQFELFYIGQEKKHDLIIISTKSIKVFVDWELLIINNHSVSYHVENTVRNMHHGR